MSRSALLWVLLAAIVVLLLVAVVAGALFLALRSQPATSAGWSDPVTQIVPEAIISELALYPLAGASELETIDATIANGDLDTAYAILAFSQELSDQQRIGRLLLLAGGFADGDAPGRASNSYQQIYDTAILSPVLNDPSRAGALLAAANGWSKLGSQPEALNAYDQVYKIAIDSPYLQMAQRRELLTQLETAYLQISAPAQAAASRERILELDYATEPHSPASGLESPELPTGIDVVSSAELGELEDARRQAAYTLLQAIAEGASAPAGMVDNLAQALRAEDEAKLALYQHELDLTTQPGRRINVQWHLIRWLLLKYKVAAGGIGLSVLPEWEEQLPDVQVSLSRAYEGLYFDYEDFVTALPTASLMDPGSYKARRLVNLAGRRGHYPNYPAEQLAGKLQDAVFGLMASGYIDALYADVARTGDELHFLLNPPESYGQSAE